jgi:ABC-type transport system involved in multi-copper enzyme maturation permease subunit
MATMTEVHDNGSPEVRSRVAWGAVVAGAAVALAVYVLLTLLGGAIGLAVQENAALGAGFALWSVIVALLSLFIGGWVTAQFTTGESRAEAALHGVVLWGVFFALVLWLATIGFQMGMGAMLMLDPAARFEMGATEAAWWAFFGVLLSMLAVIGGAILGAAGSHYLRERRRFGGRSTAAERPIGG